MLTNSPVERFCFDACSTPYGEVNFWLKRDDLLDPEIDGNKARKFYSLYTSELSDIDTIVSYGGAQSNAMYSLSALAKMKQKKFYYFTKKLPKTLSQPMGNLKHALQNGMVLVELESGEYDNIAQNGYKAKARELFVPQGGACELSREGVWMLADELNRFCREQKIKQPKVIISSGTGTTAAFVSERFEGKVYTVPCVGDGAYLLTQMSKLVQESRLPCIIESRKKYPFAKPHPDLWEMYQKLLLHGVSFDLLYDVKTWLVVSENIELFADGETIFVHSGGVRGNESQIERYKYNSRS